MYLNRIPIPYADSELFLQRLRQQGLSPIRFNNPGAVLAHFGAIQAQDYAGAKWAIGLRLANARDTDIEQAIGQKTIVRTWAFRGTLHFVAPQDLRWILDLYCPRFQSSNANFFSKRGISEAVLEKSQIIFEQSLRGGNQRSREELTEALRAGGISKPETQIGYLLLWASLQGQICFGPRHGKTFTHVLLNEWLPRTQLPSREEALAQLALRYFRSHGPATLQDLANWSGQLLNDLKQGIASLGTVLNTTLVHGTLYYYLPEDTGPKTEQAFLMHAYDEYIVGYKDRSAMLDPEYKKRVEVGNGLSPTAVIDGKVVATWRRELKKDKVQLEVHPFQTLTKHQKDRLEAATNRYTNYLGLTGYELNFI